MAGLTFNNVKKIYPGDVLAVDDFNLEIEDEEFVVFVGPSGCGKSTTLRMVAGLEEITEGEIYIGDNLINDVNPKDRNIAMVFQNYALYPHMTVRENMSFSLKLQKKSKETIDKKVNDAAELLDIVELLDRKPGALSGGQAQRVALGRCIVRDPEVFLMDEPLSNLDAKLRVQMRSEIIKLHERLKRTIIYVTHDQTEAMTMGDKIVIMKDGIMHQVDTPQNVYNHPVNTFVASFIGSPQMNFIDADVSEEDGKIYLSVDRYKMELPEDKAKIVKGEGYIGKTVVLGIRPEHFHEDTHKAQVKFGGNVDYIEMLGAEKYLYLKLLGVDMIAIVDADNEHKIGEDVDLYIEENKIQLFDKETGLSILYKDEMKIQE